MAESEAKTGFGSLFQRGDGGEGAGTKASRTISTSNQQIIIRRKKEGTPGNSKTCSILVSGTSTAFALSVTEANVTITSATDGGGLATTTVNEAIYQLYQNETFVKYWEATRGAGNGTGVLVAATSAALTGGAYGAEVFTTVGEVLDLDLPSLRTALAEVTHQTSPDGVREYVPTLHDSPEITIPMNLVLSDDEQRAFRADQFARTKRNYRIVLPDPDTEDENVTFPAYVIGFMARSPKEDARRVDVILKPTGPATWSGDA